MNKELIPGFRTRAQPTGEGVEDTTSWVLAYRHLIWDHISSNVPVNQRNKSHENGSIRKQLQHSPRSNIIRAPKKKVKKECYYSSRHLPKNV